MITPDVACGGIRGFILDTGHWQVLPGRAGKVLRTGYRLDSGELVGFRVPRKRLGLHDIAPHAVLDRTLGSCREQSFRRNAWDYKS